MTTRFRKGSSEALPWIYAVLMAAVVGAAVVVGGLAGRFDPPQPSPAPSVDSSAAAPATLMLG